MYNVHTLQKATNALKTSSQQQTLRNTASLRAFYVTIGSERKKWRT